MCALNIKDTEKQIRLILQSSSAACTSWNKLTTNLQANITSKLKRNLTEGINLKKKKKLSTNNEFLSEKEKISHSKCMSITKISGLTLVQSS